MRSISLKENLNFDQPSNEWEFFRGQALLTCSSLRLEKLCPPDGSKARLRLSDTAASFHLNSSLVPGHHFSCHIELSVDPANSGDKRR